MIRDLFFIMTLLVMFIAYSLVVHEAGRNIGFLEGLEICAFLSDRS